MISQEELQIFKNTLEEQIKWVESVKWTDYQYETQAIEKKCPLKLIPEVDTDVIITLWENAWKKVDKAFPHLSSSSDSDDLCEASCMFIEYLDCIAVNEQSHPVVRWKWLVYMDDNWNLYKTLDYWTHDIFMEAFVCYVIGD